MLHQHHTRQHVRSASLRYYRTCLRRWSPFLANTFAALVADHRQHIRGTSC